jgi:hypothetical protein
MTFSTKFEIGHEVCFYFTLWSSIVDCFIYLIFVDKLIMKLGIKDHLKQEI